MCRRVLKNRAEVPKPLLLEEKELVHSTDGKKISVHSSKGLAIGEITVCIEQLGLITFIIWSIWQWCRLQVVNDADEGVKHVLYTSGPFLVLSVVIS